MKFIQYLEAHESRVLDCDCGFKYGPHPVECAGRSSVDVLWEEWRASDIDARAFWPQADRCSVCNTPYHESTGHRWTRTCVLCGPCARGWLAWLKGRMGAMGARLKDRRTGLRQSESFGDCAAKSIIGGV